MGGYISKLFYHDEHDKTLEYNSSSLILENRDTCTPQPQKKKSLIDPRSATSGITRTPIEVHYIFYFLTFIFDILFSNNFKT